MKNEQGFSLVELLIVVAIIAIIAAIAVPSLLTSRMAANESGGIEGCRTAGSAEVAYASVNNQKYGTFAQLTTDNYLDARFVNAAGFNGYTYAEDQAVTGLPAGLPTTVAGGGFGIVATPIAGSARYVYGIGVDQVVRYQSFVAPATVDPGGMAAGDGIGTVH
jgi:prepilin-type N-terminal cleavage/methylation domain-containing protein